MRFSIAAADRRDLLLKRQRTRTYFTARGANTPPKGNKYHEKKRWCLQQARRSYSTSVPTPPDLLVNPPRLFLPNPLGFDPIAEHTVSFPYHNLIQTQNVLDLRREDFLVVIRVHLARSLHDPLSRLPHSDQVRRLEFFFLASSSTK